MRHLLTILLSLLPLLSIAQTGEMRVYTVAGKYGALSVGDGGPATNALLGATEGIWIDASCNLYISDMSESRVRKVSLETGIITTIAGVGGIGSFSGDGGAATNANLYAPYGLWVDFSGNVYFADGGNKRVRKINASTGIITTFAGGGSSTGDGVSATAALIHPGYVYGDNEGNIFIGERGKIRKVNSLGVISTIAGTGVNGFSGDGGPATNAQVYTPAGMLFDASGNLLFADRANHRIRKIATSGIIETVAGTTVGYSGDGGPAINAQLAGPISFVIDKYGHLIIGDNGNDVLRKVDVVTGIISTIAGYGPPGSTGDMGDRSEGVLATAADMHPEFLYLDLDGNIYYSNYGDKVRKITNYNPGLAASGSNCNMTGIEEAMNHPPKIRIYPNPANDVLHLENIKPGTEYKLYDAVGAMKQQGTLPQSNSTLPLRSLPPGMYLLHLTDSDGRRTVHKILKE